MSLTDQPFAARRSMLRPLILTVSRYRSMDTLPIGMLVAVLGERSFGWSILLFAVINLVPMPLGSTLLTAVPLILLTAQMAMGYNHVRLPRMIARRSVSRSGLRRVVHRLQPVVRPIERIVRRRHEWIFRPRWERATGAALLAIAIALFLPIPLSGWFPAISLFISAIGLIERDGLVTLIGLVFGAVSIVVTLAMITTIVLGAEALITP